MWLGKGTIFTEKEGGKNNMGKSSKMGVNKFPATFFPTWEFRSLYCQLDQMSSWRRCSLVDGKNWSWQPFWRRRNKQRSHNIGMIPAFAVY